jgi:RNA polymerase sigma-70 factor (ECF subfamily)
LATKGAVIPAAGGVDIGCGMTAVKTALEAGDLTGQLPAIRKGIERRMPMLGTWLGRIVINEALGHVRRERPTLSIDAVETLRAAEVIAFPTASASPDPEQRMAQHQIRQILERAIDELPEPFRLVLVARLVEEISVEDTAELLGLRPETVKTRLFRARALLRRALEERLGRVLQDAFPFGGERCQRIADRVVASLRHRR